MWPTSPLTWLAEVGCKGNNLTGEVLFSRDIFRCFFSDNGWVYLIGCCYLEAGLGGGAF